MSRAGHRAERGDTPTDQTGAYHSGSDYAMPPLHPSPLRSAPPAG